MATGEGTRSSGRAARRIVAGWVLLWLIVFAGGFVAPTTIEPTGDGFHRGMNRLGAALQIHAVAAVLAIGSRIATGRLRERLTPGWIRLGRGPLWATLAFVALIAAAIAVAIARA